MGLLTPLLPQSPWLIPLFNHGSYIQTLDRRICLYFPVSFLWQAAWKGEPPPPKNKQKKQLNELKKDIKWSKWLQRVVTFRMAVSVSRMSWNSTSPRPWNFFFFFFAAAHLTWETWNSDISDQDNWVTRRQVEYMDSHTLKNYLPLYLMETCCRSLHGYVVVFLFFTSVSKGKWILKKSFIFSFFLTSLKLLVYYELLSDHIVTWWRIFNRHVKVRIVIVEVKEQPQNVG